MRSRRRSLSRAACAGWPAAGRFFVRRRGARRRATIWSSPTLDLKRKLVYVAIGNGYSGPDIKTADAVIAMDMETGQIQWSQQTAPDMFNWGCSGRNGNKGNCPTARLSCLPVCPAGRSLDLAQTAIHEEFTAGDVTAFVGGEESDRFGDLIRGSRSAQRYGRGDGPDVVVQLLFRHPKARVIARRRNDARTNRVDADALALQVHGPIGGKRACPRSGTVPDCRECNNRLSKLEQDLLVRMGLCVDPTQWEACGISAKALRSLGVGVAVNARAQRIAFFFAIAVLQRRDVIFEALTQLFDVFLSGFGIKKGVLRLPAYAPIHSPGSLSHSRH